MFKLALYIMSYFFLNLAKGEYGKPPQIFQYVPVNLNLVYEDTVRIFVTSSSLHLNDVGSVEDLLLHLPCSHSLHHVFTAITPG